MQFVGLVIALVLQLFLILLFIRFVFDWVQVFARDWKPRGPILVLANGIYTLTDPPLKALRKVIPPLRIGSVALDLSFLLVMLTVYLLMQVVLTLG